MFNFTSLFLSNALNCCSTLATSSTGTQSILSGLDEDMDVLSGATTIASGSYLLVSGGDTFLDSIPKLIATQAYVESLDEDELNDLIIKLEGKNYSINEEEKVIIKKL